MRLFEGDTTTSVDERESRRRHILLGLAALAFSIAIAVALIVFREPLERLGKWGYPGAFLLMLLNNATILFPSIGHAFIVAASRTLDPWLLGIVGGLGAALGELTGYFVARYGSKALNRSQFYQHYKGFKGFRGNFMGPTLLLFSATPLPFDVAGLFAGAAHYPIPKFLAWAGVGKILNTVALAVASHYAIGWLFEVFSNPTE